jgi:ribosomal protein L11 methylase PrmA
MKLEINVEACNPVKQDLLAGLAYLVPDQEIRETTAGCTSDRFALNFLVKEKSPDGLLQRLEAVVSRIDNLFPEEQGIDVHARNIECSEPALSTVQHGKPFSPVEGIRIIAWNAGKKNSAARAHDIRLEPAHAFGTGLHPSTCLCLHFLKQEADENSGKKYTARSVLDIGCGSGILTIAALQLGAARALAIEIDPDAVQAARRNIHINRLAHSAQVVQTSWQGVSGQYDLVLANLVPSVLFKGAPYMAKLLREQGLFITSGFPAAKITKVVRLFEKNDLRLIKESSAGGWGALLLTK